ncbi:MAG: hypothetical protein A4S14_16175 [Proteobacteria bacterium SG_bin9]|nr:MAG: hypothetical protein A4S14_16175 [Proteobacteria bacterium SG_bin9]
MEKAPDAFRTISEVADDLDVPQHVLRFWETRFSQIRPMKRSGGRRYYRPDDVDLLKGIRHLLYGEGYTIRGVQRILKEQGVRSVQGIASGNAIDASAGPPHHAEEDEHELESAEADDLAEEEEDEIDEEDEAPPPVVRAAPPRMPQANTPARDTAPQVTASRIPPVTLVEPGRDAASRMSAAEHGKLKSVLRDLQACREMLDSALKRA